MTKNPAGVLPALISLVAAVCAIVGVSVETSAQVQTATVSAAGLIVAVWQWQHHRTIRNYDNAAAKAVAARAQVTAAEAGKAANVALQAAAEANRGNGWPVAHADAHPLTAFEWESAAAAVRRLRAPTPVAPSSVGSAS